MMNEDLVARLRKRAEIRRNITGRRSVQNGEPDRIADLLEEAADKIEAQTKLTSGWSGYAWKDGEYIDDIQVYFGDK